MSSASTLEKLGPLGLRQNPNSQSLLVSPPLKFSLSDFEIENSGRTVQYKFDAQSLRLFKDAHRAGVNRLQNKSSLSSSSS